MSRGVVVMLSIILIWIYISFTTISLGTLFSAIAKRVYGIGFESLDGVVMCGLVVATIYAQSFSLFAGVGLVANIILVAISIVSIVLCKKSIKALFERVFLKGNLIRNIIFGIAFLAFAYFTSRGYMHYDSDLYHAQSIRWIEEYGVVKGLGNLHERFAYNSSAMPLAALYSMKFLGGQSYHTMSGFFALLLFGYCLKLCGVWTRFKAVPKGKKLTARVWKLSDFLCVGAIYYIATLFDEMVSPASDYIAMLMVFYVVIKFVETIECGSDKASGIDVTESIGADSKGDENSSVIKKNLAIKQGFICMLAVYAMTVKLTSALIFLLAIIPIVTLIRQKEIKKFLLFLLQGVIIVFPWITRTFLICGYLFYPFEKLDLFNVDWKIPEHLVYMDSAQVKTWGRAIYNASMVDMPASKWFPNWFSTTLSTMEKAFIIADIVAIVVLVIRLIICLVKRDFLRDKAKLQLMVVSVVVASSYVFWQLSAPLIRYGYAYVLLLSILVLGDLIKLIKGDCILGALISLYGAYKLFASAQVAWQFKDFDCYIYQQEYGTYDAVSYEINGVTFYYPAYGGDQIGYDYFPSSAAKVEVEFRGDSIKDGFRHHN